MKKLFSKIALLFVCLICFFSATACSNEPSNELNSFYYTVVESQELLDDIGDTYYQYWFDAIYKDEYSGNINLALAFASVELEDSINTVQENDGYIRELYKKVRNEKCSDEIKAVMQTYSDYYEFVVNVSGSFKTFQEGKETKKKAFASAIKNLEMEM